MTAQPGITGNTAFLVVMAKRLRCAYPSDPCERHDGTDRRHKAEEGFETCDPCKVRREAERVSGVSR